MKLKEWYERNYEKFWWVFGIVVALIFATIPPFFVFDTLTKQRSTTSWPSVDGKIIVCEVIERYNEHYDGGEGRDEYMVDFTYQYTVNSVVYENFDVYYTSGTGSSWSGELPEHDNYLLQTYPVNRTVIVYYNLENPQQSCLITGASPHTRNMIIIFPSVGFGLLFCMVLFYLLDKFGILNRRKLIRNQ